MKEVLEYCLGWKESGVAQSGNFFSVQRFISVMQTSPSPHQEVTAYDVLCHMWYQHLKAVKEYLNCEFEVLTVLLMKNQVMWCVSAL